MHAAKQHMTQVLQKAAVRPSLLSSGLLLVVAEIQQSHFAGVVESALLPPTGQPRGCSIGSGIGCWLTRAAWAEALLLHCRFSPLLRCRSSSLRVAIPARCCTYVPCCCCCIGYPACCCCCCSCTACPACCCCGCCCTVCLACCCCGCCCTVCPACCCMAWRACCCMAWRACCCGMMPDQSCCCCAATTPGCSRENACYWGGP